MPEITEEWKALSSWEKVKGEYLEKWYLTCEEFAKVISICKLGGVSEREEREQWSNFFTKFYNILMLSLIKTPKIGEHNKVLSIHVQAMISKEELPLEDYFSTILAIGDMLDQLGYNSPERKERNSPFLTDIEDLNLGVQGMSE